MFQAHILHWKMKGWHWTKEKKTSLAYAWLICETDLGSRQWMVYDWEYCEWAAAKALRAELVPFEKCLPTQMWLHTCFKTGLSTLVKLC